MTEYTLEGAVGRRPVFNASLDARPTSKGRPRVVDGRAFTPRVTAEAEEELGWLLRQAGARLQTGDLAVTAHFRVPHRRRVDLDNLVKLLLDAGNQILWDDDSQIIEIHASLERGASPYGIDLTVEAFG